MKCAEVLEMLSAYADGEVVGREATEVQTHIASCESCRTAFEALDVLHSKLAEVMHEPMESVDVSDRVMATLPGRRRPISTKWVWAGALAGLVAVSILLTVAPGHKPRPAQRMVAGPHNSPVIKAPKAVKQPSKAVAHAASEPRAKRTARIAPVMHRQVSLHRGIVHKRQIAVKQPAARPNKLVAPQLLVTSSSRDGRIEKTIAIKVGQAYVFRSKQTEISLPRNEKAAAISRPPLEIIENSGAPNQALAGG